MKPFAIACMTLLFLASCQKPSEEEKAKRMPKPPPPPSATVQSDTNIAATVGDAATVQIDAAKLSATKADFMNDEHRAWRMSSLLGARANEANAKITVTGEKGISLVLRPPHAEGDGVPVLMLTRRGEVIATVVDADDPFPPYHGRGGRLNRPGDPLPRISGVTAIRVE